MKVEIRTGGDWVEVLVDGSSVCSGHGISEHDWVDILKLVAPDVEVERPAGDFCSLCCQWTTDEMEHAMDEPTCNKCKEGLTTNES